MVETRTNKRIPAQQQQRQHHHQQQPHHSAIIIIMPQSSSRNKKMDDWMKKKRKSGAEGYAEKKQKMTIPPVESISKRKTKSRTVGRAAAHAALAISPSSTHTSSDTKLSSNTSCWSAPSNVGNLSVREKFVLSIVIFSTMTIGWALCLSYSLCGVSPCSGSTDCYLIQDLALCKATWSTLSFLSTHISDYQHYNHGWTNETTDLTSLLNKIERLQNESQMLRTENQLLSQESASRKDHVEALTLQVIELQKESQSFQLQIQKIEQDTRLGQKEVVVMQRRLQDTTTKYDETVAKLKHCKADVLEEIYKKKACGDKLYPLQATVEELRGNLTALETKCHLDGSNRQAAMQEMDAEIDKLQTKAAQDTREINSLKRLLQESMVTNAESVAKLKHCKADVLEEIYKKKACGDKLYPLQATVEELRGNLTTLEAKCHLDGTNRQAAMEEMDAEIEKLQQKSAQDTREINSLKRLLQESVFTNAESVAKLKHCKADVLEEIYKKKACGDKLYPLQATVEELRGNLTALEATCHREESSTIDRHATMDNETTLPKKKRRFRIRIRNPFRHFFQRKARRSAEL
jgi:conjugal transfer/entry exclusion protein